MDCLVNCSFDPEVLRSQISRSTQVGSTSAVSDNTRHRNSRRGIVTTNLPFIDVSDSAAEDSDDENIFSGYNTEMERPSLPVSPSLTTPFTPLDKFRVEVEDVSDDEEFISTYSLDTDAEDLFPSDQSPPEAMDNSSSPGGSVPSSFTENSDDEFDNDELELDLDLENLTGAELLAHLATLTETPSSSSLQKSKLSETQIKQIANACVLELQEHGCITQNLISFLQEVYSPASKSSRPVLPSDRPEMLSCDKPNSAEPAIKRLTYEQLCRYIGFRSLANPDIIKDIALDTVKIIKTATKTLELGDVANIKKTVAIKLQSIVLATF